LSRSQLDITDAKSISQCLDSQKPQQVINAAAYTAVDRAESDADTAYAVNGQGPDLLARACQERGIRLLHVSTDFVFDGASSIPYTPESATGPLGEYGRSKLAGEQAVVAAQPDALIVRTGWVYSSYGSNFVKTMLRLMPERDKLSVVCDQVGTPTWAQGLARTLWAAVSMENLSGIYHWSDAGVCSWYDLAVAVCEEGLALGLLTEAVEISPVATEDYPTPAQRPAYSVLDKTGSWKDFAIAGVHWRAQLRAMLKDYKELGNG
jgi:dTDP-4-dehydrorhamnose reductase